MLPLLDSDWSIADYGLQFVAYGKDIEYCIVQTSSGAFIIAKDRVDALSQLVKEELGVLATFPGRTALFPFEQNRY